jgi:hypothetical protein
MQSKTNPQNKVCQASFPGSPLHSFPCLSTHKTLSKYRKKRKCVRLSPVRQIHIIKVWLSLRTLQKGSIVQKRRLGRTRLQVSIVGFGVTWISQTSPDEAKKAIQELLNVASTTLKRRNWNGDSEEKMGTALKDVRDKCILASKAGSRTKNP